MKLYIQITDQQAEGETKDCIYNQRLDIWLKPISIEEVFNTNYKDKIRQQILIGRLSEIVGTEKAFKIASEVSNIKV